MFEIILITGSVLVLGWLLKRALGWLSSYFMVLPAQFVGYGTDLITALPKTGPSLNRVYLSKQGQYEIYQGANEPKLTGSLLDLSDIADTLNSDEMEQLKAKLKAVEKNPYDLVLRDLVLRITVARNQTPDARPRGVKISGEFFVNTKASQLSTIELKPITGETPHRYIICYCPNGVSYRQLIDSYQELANQNNAIVVCFDYPNVGNSIGSASSETKLINAGKAQVQRLLDKEIPANKITLYGHSLGGAIATIVAASYHKEKQPVSLINDRSFSKVSDVASGFIQNPILRKIIKGITTPLAWALDWSLDAASAYRSIPSQNKMLIVTKQDEVINYRVASVYQKEKSQVTKKGMDKAQKKQLFHAYKQSTAVYKIEGPAFQFQHSVSINTLKDKTDQIPIMQKISHFIAK